jgi:hypothetical protein
MYKNNVSLCRVFIRCRNEERKKERIAPVEGKESIRVFMKKETKFYRFKRILNIVCQKAYIVYIQELYQLVRAVLFCS